jgi:hypothetical protein
MLDRLIIIVGVAFLLILCRKELRRAFKGQ